MEDKLQKHILITTPMWNNEAIRFILFYHFHHLRLSSVYIMTKSKKSSDFVNKCDVFLFLNLLYY